MTDEEFNKRAEEAFLKAREEIKNADNQDTQDFINWHKQNTSVTQEQLNKAILDVGLEIAGIHEDMERIRRALGIKWRFLEWARSLI